MYFRDAKKWLSEAPASANDPDPIEGICPPGLTLLYAQPNCGKSYLGLTIARAMVAGEKEIFGFKINRHTPVIYFSLDDTSKTLKERIEDLGLGDHDNFIIVDENDFSMVENVMEFDGIDGCIVNFTVREAAKQKESTPGLIIVDTWEKIRTTKDHDYSSEVEELAPLKRRAEQIGYNVLLIHHANKYGRTKNNKFADYYGSNGVAGETNVMMKLELIPDTSVYLLSIEGNSYRGKPELHLVRDDDGSFKICPEEEVNLIPEVPEKDFSKIRRFMILNARKEASNKFSYVSDYGQFCVDADLECSNVGLGKLLKKYRPAFAEDGITFWTERGNHHRGMILHITCDLS